jgi:hypothetical protein
VVCCRFAPTAFVTSCFSLLLVAVVITSVTCLRHSCSLHIVTRCSCSPSQAPSLCSATVVVACSVMVCCRISHHDQQQPTVTGRCQNYARKRYPTTCGTFLRTRRNKKYVSTRVPTGRFDIVGHLRLDCVPKEDNMTYYGHE